VSMVGVILVVGLLITPAATAYLLSDRLDRMMCLAALFGVTSVVGGLYLCVWLDSAGGGAIMLFCTLQFLVVLTVAPKYGLFARWLRLRNLVPQQVIEDILTTVLRFGKRTPIAVIRQYVVHGSKSIQKALQRMVQDGLLRTENEGYHLTEKGEKEANKVLRAHRLWEAYLETIGTPEDQLHPTAHHLEHISDGNTVDYLDEKLGNPVQDPHGKSIP
ncbi:MAG: metal ABC transporter permease, partial [Deltaproteobacteria bacterium]|nr:metal ABC transporter permease [Deltaproteobacteria bacterium]